jgi:hypothetical protein
MNEGGMFDVFGLLLLDAQGHTYLAREGARCCCGGTSGGGCACTASYILSDCGLGSIVVGCCACPEEWTLRLSLRVEYNDLFSEVFDFLWGSHLNHTSRSSHCEETQTTYDLQVYDITLRRRCVQGRTLYDWTGSSFRHRILRTGDGVVTQDEDVTVEGELVRFGLAAFQGMTLDDGRCYLSPNDIGSRDAQGSTGTGCSRSGHNEARYSLHGTLSPCGDSAVMLPFGYAADGSPTDCYRVITQEDSSFFGEASCLGGQASNRYSSSWSGTADCPFDSFDLFSLIAGIHQGQTTYTREASWRWSTDTICPVDPCGPPPPVGACCTSNPYGFGSNNCIIATAAGCLAIGGIYRGDGTTCATAVPPCPEVRRCCLPGGGCVERTIGDCIALGGRWGAAGAHCPGIGLGDPCEGSGACCNQDGTCTIATAGACLAGGGRYLGDGTLCTGSPCALRGSCCIDSGRGGCVDGVTLSECQALAAGRIFGWDVGRTCGQVSCRSSEIQPINPSPSSLLLMGGRAMGFTVSGRFVVGGGGGGGCAGCGAVESGGM